MTSIFNSGFELRNQLVLKMFPNYNEAHFAAIELIHNIKKGNWLNVMIMRDTFPIFREARLFGGKRVLRGNYKLLTINNINNNCYNKNQ